jgi:hypothetical protein
MDPPVPEHESSDEEEPIVVEEPDEQPEHEGKHYPKEAHPGKGSHQVPVPTGILPGGLFFPGSFSRLDTSLCQETSKMATLKVLRAKRTTNATSST